MPALLALCRICDHWRYFNNLKLVPHLRVPLLGHPALEELYLVQIQLLPLRELVPAENQSIQLLLGLLNVLKALLHVLIHEVQQDVVRI